MIKILVDSSSDLTFEEIKGRNIDIIPLEIHLDGKDYIDGVTIDKDEFYNLLKNSTDFPKTSMPSPDAFLKFFNDAKNNCDDIIYISISSHFSGAYQSAILAKEMTAYDGIHIIDSYSLSACIKIMAEYAEKLINEGYSAQEIVRIIEKFKSRVRVYAVLDTLEYLYRGGRLNRASAMLGTLAKIKPTVTALDGKVGLIKKSLGLIKAKKEILDLLKNTKIDCDFPIYSLYSCGTENCERLEADIKEINLKVSERIQLCPTIGSHIGIGAFGVFFVEAE